jgi:AcrR family transcriptional regulator
MANFPVDSVNMTGTVDDVNELSDVRRMGANLRDELVVVAAELLDEGGPAAVTLREVGARAGVSRTAPYRHFADKDALLAAIAARELSRRLAPDATSSRPPSPMNQMLGYVRWAQRHPARFKLTFGAWSGESAELGDSAHLARQRLVEAVVEEQRAGRLPKGDPERVAALVLALAHGAADLALSGHLAADGKGHASPEDLVADLFAYLASAGGSAGT